MTITATSLMKAAGGPVDATLFPETPLNEVEAQLGLYLTAAYDDARVAAQTDLNIKDSLARNWALYLTFDGVAQRMTAEPLTVNNGPEGGSTGYSKDQILMMQARADKYLADFLALLNVDLAVVPSQFPGTVSLRTRVDFL
jgi:hypothetical protein